MATQANARHISQFAPHEITSEAFRDSLSRTIDTLARAFQSQAAEVKALKAEIERLNKRENRNAGPREQEWQSFQWLFEELSDDDGDEEADIGVGKRRRKANVRKAALTGSDDDLDDDEDDDSVATDDMSAFGKGMGNARAKKARKESSGRTSKEPVTVKEEAVARPSHAGLQAPVQMQQTQKSHPQIIAGMPISMQSMPFALQGSIAGFKPHAGMQGVPIQMVGHNLQMMQAYQQQQQQLAQQQQLQLQQQQQQQQQQQPRL